MNTTEIFNEKEKETNEEVKGTLEKWIEKCNDLSMQSIALMRNGIKEIRESKQKESK